MQEKKAPNELLFDYRPQIMGFAAFWIMCSHSIGIVGDTLWPYLIQFKPLMSFGWGGVDIFLFISGLGIGLSLKKNPSKAQFFSKRFNRIFIHKHFKTRTFVILSVLVYFVICYVAYKYGHRTLSDYGLHFLAFIFITPGLIFMLTQCFTLLNRIKYVKIVVKSIGVVGKVSLEFYLIHWVLLCVIDAYDWTMPWGLFILFSLLLAYIVHWMACGLEKVERERLKY